MTVTRNPTGLPVKWTADTLANLILETVQIPEVGFYAQVQESPNLLYQAVAAGTGASSWSVVPVQVNVSSGVNYVKMTSAATGSPPFFTSEGDANNGFDFENSENEEILKLRSAATSVNEITITSAATTAAPSIAATGGDTNVAVTLAGKGTGKVSLGQATCAGVELVASQPLLDENDNELIKFSATASAVNEITVTNAATTGTPAIAASGGDSNVNLSLGGKGTGYLLLASHVDQNGKHFCDGGGLELLKFSETASAVNEITVKNAATTNAPDIQATGDDTNIHLKLTPKGNGYVQCVGGFVMETATLTANNDSGAGSTIEAGCTQAAVTGVTADANDWIVLPAVANVPIGHTITVACNAGSNFECRTPATSGTKINNVDSDGTQELLMTDTTVVVFRCLGATDGWTAVEYPLAGGVSAAVTPD